MTVFLELFVLAAACYLALVARTHLRRFRRRRELRRAWREPVQGQNRPPRPASATPAGMA